MLATARSASRPRRCARRRITTLLPVPDTPCTRVEAGFSDEGIFDAPEEVLDAGQTCIERDLVREWVPLQAKEGGSPVAAKSASSCRMSGAMPEATWALAS